MIDDYVNTLIENLPTTATPQRLDLVLDGGIFNGSYLVGALYFLKEMERRNMVRIERISGCSIGSIVAFLYYLNALDLMPSLYDTVHREFKRTMTLRTITQLKTHLKDRIPDDICARVNDKLFVCYHDIKRHKKVVKSTYQNADDIIDTLIRSCYVPLLVDSRILYKRRYMDGLNAFIFPKESNKKILHMELFGYDKWMYALNVKNEKTNFHRILSGLLDIHGFFIKQSNTSMCSYVDQWSLLHKAHCSLKQWIEMLLVYAMYLLQYVKPHVPKDLADHVLVKIVAKMSVDIFSILLETYCL